MAYTEQERRVYRCPVTQRYYDPLATLRSLLAAAKGPGGFNGALADSRATGDDAEARRLSGEGRMVAAARVALALPAVDPKTGDGVTDAVVLESLTAFTRYLSGKGETALAGPSGAPCTDCPPGR